LCSILGLQIAFLRGQLAYALQESEAESLELTRQLAATAAEAGALRESLRAEEQRAAERGQLVSELSGTVQEQKGRLQVGPDATTHLSRLTSHRASGTQLVALNLVLPSP
jgi:hypothetical protein